MVLSVFPSVAARGRTMRCRFLRSHIPALSPAVAADIAPAVTLAGRIMVSTELGGDPQARCQRCPLLAKAEVPPAPRDFRLWHKAEVPPASCDFRFWGLNGHPMSAFLRTSSAMQRWSPASGIPSSSSGEPCETRGPRKRVALRATGLMLGPPVKPTAVRFSIARTPMKFVVYRLAVGFRAG